MFFSDLKHQGLQKKKHATRAEEKNKYLLTKCWALEINLWSEFRNWWRNMPEMLNTMSTSLQTPRYRQILEGLASQTASNNYTSVKVILVILWIIDGFFLVGEAKLPWGAHYDTVYASGRHSLIWILV